MRSLGRSRRLQSPTLLWPRYTPDNTGLCSPGFKGSLLPLNHGTSHRWWGASDPQFSTLGDG